ncbi:MAG: hypothetical protein AB7N71_05265 [Phycisphaerae bacterium]
MNKFLGYLISFFIVSSVVAAFGRTDDATPLDSATDRKTEEMVTALPEELSYLKSPSIRYSAFGPFHGDLGAMINVMPASVRIELAATRDRMHANGQAHLLAKWKLTANDEFSVGYSNLLWQLTLLLDQMGERRSPATSGTEARTLHNGNLRRARGHRRDRFSASTLSGTEASRRVGTTSERVAREKPRCREFE